MNVPSIKFTQFKIKVKGSRKKKEYFMFNGILLYGTQNTFYLVVRGLKKFIFIGPESDHWQCLSLTD